MCGGRGGGGSYEEGVGVIPWGSQDDDHGETPVEDERANRCLFRGDSQTAVLPILRRRRIRGICSLPAEAGQQGGRVCGKEARIREDPLLCELGLNARGHESHHDDVAERRERDQARQHALGCDFAAKHAPEEDARYHGRVLSVQEVVLGHRAKVGDRGEDIEGGHDPDRGEGAARKCLLGLVDLAQHLWMSATIPTPLV